MRTAAGMIVLLAVFLFAAGCLQTADSRRFTGEFQQIPLSEAPADLQALYERMKVAPGLFVLQRGGQTYLLLCAGKTEGGEQGLEVLEVQNPRAPARRSGCWPGCAGAPEQVRIPTR